MSCSCRCSGRGAASYSTAHRRAFISAHAEARAVPPAPVSACTGAGAHQAVVGGKAGRHDHLAHEAHGAGSQHEHRVRLIALLEQQPANVVRASLHDLRNLVQQRHRYALEHRQPPQQLHLHAPTPRHSSSIQEASILTRAQPHTGTITKVVSCAVAMHGVPGGGRAGGGARGGADRTR